MFVTSRIVSTLDIPEPPPPKELPFADDKLLMDGGVSLECLEVSPPERRCSY